MTFVILGKQVILGVGQQKYKMSLEHPRELEYKEALYKKRWDIVKEPGVNLNKPTANPGTV